MSEYETESRQPQLTRSFFGEDFIWGVSVAAYQIEGGANCDGKGQSIWDVFTSRKGKIKNQDHGNTACDFYSLYQQDIDLVKKLQIPNFRFSISWTRIFPLGTGEKNLDGINFYNRVIDYCLAQGIEPWITIYHWDLPHALELLGGWTNRAIIEWFSAFVSECANQFGDRVKNWMVMNEPAVFVGAGYFLGLHAPGRHGMKNFLPAIHHAVLSMAEGGRALRAVLPGANIGTTFSCSLVEPLTGSARDLKAARKVDALLNRLFIEPILGLGYPIDVLPALKDINKYIQPTDQEKMKFSFDFIGIQNYTREVVRSSFLTPYLGASLVKAKNRKVPVTLMGWEVYPRCIYAMIKKFNAYPQIKKIMITENGSAFSDTLTDGHVHDNSRVNYLAAHIAEVQRAKADGYKVDGYFVWTLTDNFEWAEGYHPRFGLVYVDFASQKRYIKDSGHWYAEFLNS